MKQKIKKLLETITPKNAVFDVFVPEKSEFGHYSTNLALRLSESGDKLKLAQELAKKILEKSPKGFFQKVEAIPPGFINFWLSSKILRNELKNISRAKEKYGRENLGRGKKIIIEYSQPNIAKKMHVGHLRSTIIGDALANIYEWLGYKVIRWNYLGDWGTQFGKLIAEYKRTLDKEGLESAEYIISDINTTTKAYVRFHNLEINDIRFSEKAREEFKKLEEGDQENRKLWKRFRAESLKEFKEIYKILGVEFDNWTGESAYEKELKPLIRELRRRGVAKESEGAIVIPLEKFNLPLALIQKADGASLYLTRDIASLKERIKKYRSNEIVYVVSNEQTLHLEQLFAVAEILGLNQAKLVHAKFGLMLDEKGQKFSTREGRGIELRELMAKIIERAEAAVKKKNPSLPSKERVKIAEAIGIGALKYNDLKENRRSDIVFDWKRMLDFSGQSAPYLQYTHARLKSILRKAPKISRADLVTLVNDLESSLIKKMIDFPPVIEESGKMFLTNNLANYLYELAVLANKFYETTPIIKDTNAPRRNARLVLIDATAAVLRNGLQILGIKTPERI